METWKQPKAKFPPPRTNQTPSGSILPYRDGCNAPYEVYMLIPTTLQSSHPFLSGILLCRCGSNNRHQKDTCLKEINGQCALNMLCLLWYVLSYGILCHFGDFWDDTSYE